MDLASMDGMFVGMLDDEELECFQRAVEKGLAMRSYSGAGWLLGLAQVRLLDTGTEP